MFFVIIVAALSVMTVVKVKKMLYTRLLTKYNELKVLSDRHESLSKKLKDLRTQESLLIDEYHNVVILYEVTKHISKTLNKQEVFRSFKDILKSFININNCILLDIANTPSNLKDHFIFPLRAGQEDMGSLAVKGLDEGSKDKFIILANQFVLVMRRAQLYLTVQELSITDSLTQMMVKRYCMIRLKEEFLRSEKKKLNLSCLMLDIDNFKDYNDKFGHLVGDVILVEVSKVINDNIRQIDLLGRFGGEEFLLVLPETDKQAALFVAERIRKAIEEKVIKAYDDVFRATISIGIAGFPADANNYNNLIDRADKALYQAKQVGKNRVCLYSTKQR